jgi:hypothetical protein
MKILFLNINLNWVYNLFSEYIINSKQFIKDNFNDITIDIIHYNKDTFKIINFDIFLFCNYDKIIYSGDIDIFNEILNKVLLIYKKIINNIYFLNIEQLSHPSYYKNFIKIRNDIKIIDYSEENIPYINFNKYKNFILPPYFLKESIDINFKNIDLLSLDNNLFRKDIIKEINNELNIDNLPQITVINDCYGVERDNIYRKTKIYINIHCSNEHNTMELIRISNLLSKNVIVISYNTVNTQLLYIRKNILIANNIEEIKKIILEVYKNYNFYYDFFDKKNNENDYKKYIKNNLDSFINDNE